MHTNMILSRFFKISVVLENWSIVPSKDPITNLKTINYKKNWNIKAMKLWIMTVTYISKIIFLTLTGSLIVYFLLHVPGSYSLQRYGVSMYMFWRHYYFLSCVSCVLWCVMVWPSQRHGTERSEVLRWRPWPCSFAWAIKFISASYLSSIMVDT